MRVWESILSNLSLAASLLCCFFLSLAYQSEPVIQTAFNCQGAWIHSIYAVSFWTNTIKNSRTEHLMLGLLLHLVLFPCVFLQVTVSDRRALTWRLDVSSWSRSSSTSQHDQLEKDAVQLQGHPLWLCMENTRVLPPAHKQVQRHQQKSWLHVCYEEWRTWCSILSKLHLPLVSIKLSRNSYRHHNGIWYLKQTNMKLTNFLIVSLYMPSFIQVNPSWVSMP